MFKKSTIELLGKHQLERYNDYMNRIDRFRCMGYTHIAIENDWTMDKEYKVYLIRDDQLPYHGKGLFDNEIIEIVEFKKEV